MLSLKRILNQAYALTLLGILPGIKHSSLPTAQRVPDSFIRKDKHPEGLAKRIYEGMGYDTNRYTYGDIEAMEREKLRDDPRFQEAKELVQDKLNLLEDDRLIGVPYLREINHQQALHEIVSGVKVVTSPLSTHDDKLFERMQFARMVELAAEDMGYKPPKDSEF